MKEYITLADGTVVENAYVVKLSGTNIAVYVSGSHTFAEMSGWFGDPEKTKRMVSEQYGEKATWKGFTVVTTVQINAGESYVCLQKP